MISVLTGLAAGAAHVVSGPDHLAALAPVAMEQPRRAVRLGLRWGFGHALGVAALGGLGMVARQWIDIEAVSFFSEFLVGAVLILVGLWALRRALRVVVHTHPHAHEHGEAAPERAHSHYHLHSSLEDHGKHAAHSRHAHAAFAVGLLHGMAGTGHLLGVLPSLALAPVDAALYLSAYVLSAVLSMGLFGGLMGLVVRRGGPTFLRSMMFGASFAAVGLGLLWLHQGWPALQG